MTHWRAFMLVGKNRLPRALLTHLYGLTWTFR
jgi:hypothetical protein